jgi:putative transposase
MRLFHKDGDYAAFERVLSEAIHRYPVDLLTYCLMDNHWHLVVKPRTDEALGKMMGWIGVTHVRRHHEHYHTRGGGHLYQGRFKSFPVQTDRYFLTLCRYVEANAVRAGIVRDALNWPWGGAAMRQHPEPLLPLTQWPVDRPRNWHALLNDPIDTGQIEQMRTSITRGRPLGDEPWVKKTASRLGLEFTLRNPGRPSKVKKP